MGNAKELEMEQHWLKVAQSQLLGKRIVGVRYMSKDEAKELDWHNRPIVFILDCGNIIFPAKDNEGNNGGALFTNDEKNPVIPVL